VSNSELPGAICANHTFVCGRCRWVVLKRDVVASDPDVIAKWLGKHCSGLSVSCWRRNLYHGLIERSRLVDCICARHAEGLAQLTRTGWFKRMHMKASATHIDRAALRIRTQLIAT
jgi:transposase